MRSFFAAFMAVVGLSGALPAPVLAGRSTELLSLAELLPEPGRIHPDVASQVSADLSGMGSVAAQLSDARSDVVAADNIIVSSVTAIGSLEVDLRLVQAELTEWQSEEGTAHALSDAADEDLAAFAVDTFVGFEGLDLRALRLEGTVDPADTLADEAGALLTTVAAEAAERYRTAVRQVNELEDEVAGIDQEIAKNEEAQATAEQAVAEARARVDEITPAFELALLGATVEGTDFPIVVLDAYYRAQLVVAEERPGCEVRWDQLAGIGKIESRHGTYGGTSVGADGRTDGEILGPVLDGDPWLAIPDTDGGLHDGDVVWDRAVGPMQFIPGSWKIYGRDGDGDDFADPHNMYDAALAAAQHLCGTTGGLSAPGNFQRALLGYNRSVTYGLAVMRATDNYRDVVGLNPGPDSIARPDL